MLNKLLISTAFIALGATSSLAQGFSGGEISIENSSYDEGDYSVTSFSGSVEFDVAAQFGVGLDLTGYSVEDSDSDISNATLHGIYKFDQATSVGLFYAFDSIDDVEIDGFGIEASYRTPVSFMDGYFGKLEDEFGDEASIFGASVNYSLGNGFSVTGDIDALTFPDDDLTYTDLALGGAYTYQTATFFAKLGNYSISIDDGVVSDSFDDNYIAIGANFAFGPNNGSTYNSRSVFNAAF